ncbi:hypothetical protein BGW80DRAFT_908562 [Lactifluus volemus]|nr:hypothetical protein BGW80DRAFT_908562 [Lactifluus volemus]
MRQIKPTLISIATPSPIVQKRGDGVFSVALRHSSRPVFFRPVIAFLSPSVCSSTSTQLPVGHTVPDLASQSFLSDTFCQLGQTSAQILLFLPLPRYKGNFKLFFPPSPSTNDRENACVWCQNQVGRFGTGGRARACSATDAFLSTSCTTVHQMRHQARTKKRWFIVLARYWHFHIQHAVETACPSTPQRLSSTANLCACSS